MRIVLFNDEGRSIASVEHSPQSDDSSSAQAFAVLDLVEKLLESARAQRGKASDPITPARQLMSPGAG